MGSGADVGEWVNRWIPRNWTTSKAWHTGIYVERPEGVEFVGWAATGRWTEGLDGTIELQLEDGALLRFVRIRRLPPDRVEELAREFMSQAPADDWEEPTWEEPTRDERITPGRARRSER